MKEVPQNEPAIVGKTYLVNCVRLVKPSWPFGSEWVPIAGPRHEDKEYIGFPQEHYHVDHRFVSKAMFDRMTLGRSKHVAKAVNGHVFCVTLPRIGTPIPYEKTVKAMRCKREQIAFPDAPWDKVLRKQYKNHSLKDCLLCPHRALPLGPHADEEGIAICPGHGLVWNVRERRIATPEEERAARQRKQKVTA